MPASPPPAACQRSEGIPDFVYIRRLGAGAFGEVWLAHDRALDVDLAVKLVPPTSIRHIADFYQEAQSLRALSHPHIVAIQDAGPLANGGLYLAMEFMPRGSAEDEAQGGIMPLRRAISIVRDACRGVQYIHDKNYVHRDLKPANILIARNGTGKVSDFGLVTQLDARGQASAYGYIAHLAPEVLTDDAASSQSDVYALGVTLYRLINGDSLLPSFADVSQLEQLILAGTFPNRTLYRPFVPRALRQVINRAMAPKAADRYPTVDAFRHDLERADMKCDWALNASSSGDQWNGISDGRVFEVKLDGSRGSWNVTTRVGPDSGSLRRRNDQCLAAASRAKAEQFLAKVLSAVSQTGR